MQIQVNGSTLNWYVNNRKLQIRFINSAFTFTNTASHHSFHTFISSLHTVFHLLLFYIMKKPLNGFLAHQRLLAPKLLSTGHTLTDLSMARFFSFGNLLIMWNFQVMDISGLLESKDFLWTLEAM
jgi:hypothetical protein